MNKNKRTLRSLCKVWSLLLIAALAISLTACTQPVFLGGGTTTATATRTTVTIHTPPTGDPNAPIPVGVGETDFTFEVHAPDGTVTTYLVSTDEATVGAALLNLGLIDGEESQYGLYVKTVNGIPLDYDKDHKYWAFYVNGTYAVSGVDSTTAQAGVTYAFKAENA